MSRLQRNPSVTLRRDVAIRSYAARRARGVAFKRKSPSSLTSPPPLEDAANCRRDCPRARPIERTDRSISRSSTAEAGENSAFPFARMHATVCALQWKRADCFIIQYALVTRGRARIALELLQFLFIRRLTPPPPTLVAQPTIEAALRIYSRSPFSIHFSPLPPPPI